MITVIHKRDQSLYPEDRQVYVGRPSALGNPFAMANKADTAERNTVITQYTAWLHQQIREKNAAVLSELKRIYAMRHEGPVYLICWCAPQPCHADVIRTIVDNIYVARSTSWPSDLLTTPAVS